MQIPQCLIQDGPNRDFMCTTKNGDMYYCECCNHQDNHWNCISRSSNRGLDLNTDHMSILDIKNGVPVDNGIFIEQKGITDLVKQCADQKYAEVVCRIDSEQPDTTHCMCTDYSTKATEVFDFDTKSLWDKYIQRDPQDGGSESTLYKFLTDPTSIFLMISAIAVFCLILYLIKQYYNQTRYRTIKAIPSKYKSYGKKKYTLLSQSDSENDDDIKYMDV